MALSSSEQCHPIQQTSSFAYGPTTAFQNRKSTPLSLKSILLTYMKYRRTADARKYPHQVVKILHKRLCKNGRCTCDRLLRIFDHVENCLNFECTLCKRLRNSFGKRAVEGSSGYTKSSCDRPDIYKYYPHRSMRVKVVSVDTQSIQLSTQTQPAAIHDETPPVKDIVMVENPGDDLYVESNTPICLNKTSVSLYPSEVEMNRVEEENIVLGKSSQPNQATKTDPNIGGVSTQSIQLSPCTQPRAIHDETDPVKDIVMAENFDDDLYVESDTPICLNKMSVPLYSSEVEKNRVEEEKIVLGKSNQPTATHDETPPAKDIAMAEISGDDTYMETNTLICLNKTSVPLYSSEVEMNRVEEEKIVLGEPNQPNQTTKTDRNIRGVSIFEFLTANEIQEHLSSLRTSTNQDIEEIKTENPCDDNTCNLCGNQNVKFSPKPLFCLSCTGRIKEGLVYYSTFDEKGSKICVCATCHNRGGHITVEGKTIPKLKFRKEKNDLGDEEHWVQCDKCAGWQHQICALYNDQNDLSGNTEYICPKCFLVRIESGDHVPVRNIPTFGAKDLPVTKLGDYIENRLLKRLNQDRKVRAKVSRKNFDEVPGATDLVVRVVVSANKVLKVNEQFSQIFSDVKYPSEFPYRSKVILLFQKIDGIDICIFAMYVQEYGSECGPPNQRSVYISHIDSIKHFQPNIKSVCGEALRTFTYHEILIGYLEYCKKRGFTTAYIWSCPPLKGDDYVFYCHPKTQKTPKLDILRQWYMSMLTKAVKENIVAGLTNLYDHYFIPNEKSNVKVSAARLPYFDGDYCSSAAISMINKSEKGNRLNFKKSKEVVSRRTLKAFGRKEISEDATRDILLMQQLGEMILPSKKDFIVVQLQVSDDVATDTEDDDSILETTLFDEKNSFLSFCQGNEQRFPYQFDELRRAKHSSMMILYYLHGSIKKIIQDCEKKDGNIDPFTNKKTGPRSLRGCLRYRMRNDTLSYLKGH